MPKVKLKETSLLLLLLLCGWASFASAGIKLIENKGQWESNILCRANIPGGTYYVEKKRLTYFFYDVASLHLAMHDHNQVDPIQCHVVRVNFKNANPEPQVVNSDPSIEGYNYFIGNNPLKWASGTKAYGKVTLKNLWKGIDMEIISQDDALKYNFIVNPGADASQIQLEYEGADSTYVQNEALNIKTKLCHMQEDKPLAYLADGENDRVELPNKKGKSKVNVKCSYKLQNNILHFATEKYDHSKSLVIDPTVIFATYSGSYADNFGFTGTYDSSGCAYSGGTVFSNGFPATTGAFQVKFQGGNTDVSNPNGITTFARDVGILKYSPDGKSLLWATYIGGNDNEQPHSMIVDKNGELIIFGTTYSSNFPVTQGAFSTKYSGNGDIFVCRLSRDASKLSASTFIGGSGMDGLNGPYEYNPNGTCGPLAYNYGDHFRGEVIIDKSGNILIASCTRSGNFPLFNAIQSSLKGMQDACILKLRPDLSGIVWSTLLGGNDEDAAYGINMDSKGNVFITGGTQSSNFPVTKGSAFSKYAGNIDGFIAKIDKNGKGLLACTYLGTQEYDQSYFVQIDLSNKIYVTGQTTGSFPVSKNVYTNQNGKQFIAEFDNDLSAMTLSTVFGTGKNRQFPDLSPAAFLVDICGRVCVSGWGGEVNYDYNGLCQECGTNGMPVTSDAFQKNTDNSDFYLIVLGRNFSSLVYASYFGGTHGGLEHVDGGTSRFDQDGKVYQSVCGGCGGYSDFPTTPGAWSRQNKGKRPWPLDPNLGGCNNAMFKMDLNSSTIAPHLKDSVTTIVVNASDEVDFKFDITEPDPNDSIFISYDGSAFDSKKIRGNIASLIAHNGKGTVHAELKWLTNCSEISMDTYTVNLHMHDNGCPVQKFSEGKINIVVVKPPKCPAPGIFCVEPYGDGLKLNWSDIYSGKYLKYYNLVKISPDGNQKIVKQFNRTTDNHFIDYDVFNYRVKDYCYFIYGTNICDENGDSTRRICSVPDKDSIPSGVYVHSVSIINNKNIQLSWSSQGRPDFFLYDIYRKENIPGAVYELYSTIQQKQNDTVFIDSAVDVNHKSYCYKVNISTQCGIYSPDKYYGTSILLEGEAIPFEDHIKWNEYALWKGDVQQYEILRSDSSSLYYTVNGIPKNSSSYIDNQLNNDWGDYHYKIIAHEGQGGEGAISESNEIELIQKPVLYTSNVFTPNADGLNDGWKPVSAFIKEFHLKIYNRWGALVWQSDDKKAIWKGSFLNNSPFNNVFIWQVDYTGWDKSSSYKSGNITILK